MISVGSTADNLFDPFLLLDAMGFYLTSLPRTLTFTMLCGWNVGLDQDGFEPIRIYRLGIRFGRLTRKLELNILSTVQDK